VPSLPHPVSESRTLLPKSIFLASSLVILFCCVALAFYITSGRSEKAGVAPGMPLRSLAILPFKPLVSDHADPALELGMTDALITRLGSIKGIVVRPTGSILRYTDGERNIRDIGNELDVEVLLDGKVQKVGKRVRLSVQLVRARDGAVLWAGAFDEETGDILAVQDSVSGRVAETLAWKLSGEDRERLTKIDATNGEAYELYLRGRYFWNKRSVEGLKTGLDYFKRAAEKDLNFALAYAGQADSYLLLGLRNALPAQMARDEARAAATIAIKLNESLAEPHASLARVEEFSGHRADAEREYLRATELNPNYPTARFWHSRFLLRRKRIEEAVPEAEKAHNLDPLSLPVNMNLGEVLFHARRYDGAARQFRKTRELDQNFETRQLNYYLYASYAQAGKYEEAIPPLATILSKSDALKGARIEAELSDALHAQGAQGLWRKEIEMLKRDADEDYTILFADAYVRLGEKNEAFEWLNRCADRLNWQIYFLNLDPTFDPLRSDARYAELMQRLDLQP
jgi:TolB-like protein/Tfp pilus assembly protein PilF